MSMIVCPCCKATNPTAPLCRRCKADLSLLFKLQTDREQLLAAAATCLTDGQLDDAMALLDQAEFLRVGPDVNRLRAVARLLAGDYSAAYEHYQLAEA